jgi:hypothetical protein
MVKQEFLFYNFTPHPYIEGESNEEDEGWKCNEMLILRNKMRETRMKINSKSVT